MTWDEMRRDLREYFDKIEEVEMELHGRLIHPRPYLRWLDRNKYSTEHLGVIATDLGIIAIKDCSSDILHDMLVGLDHSDEFIRITVGFAFGACGYEPAIDGLIRLLRETNDQETAEKYGMCLTAIGKGAVPSILDLVQAAQEGQEVMFNEALAALVRMGPDAVDWILETFRDKDAKSGRWMAGWHVLLAYKAEAEPKLERLMDEANEASIYDLTARILGMRVNTTLRYLWSEAENG